MIKDRTIEDYKVAGAWMRLLKCVESKAHIECSKVLLKSDSDKFHVIENRLYTLCSNAENNMFDDFPAVGDEYVDVFYGAVDAAPRNRLDREQIELAKELATGLFGDNWDR